MAIINSFTDLSKYSRQICGRKRFRRHIVKGIKANEVSFEELPVETRIKRVKQELGPKIEIKTAYSVLFFGELVSISKETYDMYFAMGVPNIFAEPITVETNRV